MQATDLVDNLENLLKDKESEILKLSSKCDHHIEIQAKLKIDLDNERQKSIAGAERVKALEGELAEAKGDRDAQAKEAREAREEAELSLLQLHQVQEELEHYLCQSRTKEKLLKNYQAQQQRAKELLSICLSKTTAQLPDPL